MDSPLPAFFRLQPSAFSLHFPLPRTREILSTSRRVLTTAQSHPEPGPFRSKFGTALQDYFRSGWAFFIPYLAAYLLYAWLKWPVNPSSPGPWKGIPCLLHVYWALHLVHLGFAAGALRAWWSRRSPQDSPSEILIALAPWIFIALVFWIPGIYLEWPADPWEHLRRINEWRWLDTVTAHSSWMKFSYFLPYSLTEFWMGEPQINALGWYTTAVSLMLCWQYYRLARALGLSKQTAMLFVLAQSLVMGNNVFSFYRYYALSSSPFAQLGAVALTRFAIETTECWRRRSSLCFILCTVFTVFNHPQGIGIAGMGILAIVLWRLSAWRLWTLPVLLGLTVAASIAVVAWLPHPEIIETRYVKEGWLTSWFAFNLFDADSPAFQRSMEIVSAIGVFNLLASLFLYKRAPGIFWLTLTPFLVLLIPAMAIPISLALSSAGGAENIGTFHRFLFAVPMPLAIIILSVSKNENEHNRVLAG